MEYFGPERIYAGDVRVGQIIFSSSFKFGQQASGNADFSVSIDVSKTREVCDAYDPSRAIANFRVVSIVPLNAARKPVTKGASIARVVAERLDSENQPTSERITFDLAHFLTSCLEHVLQGPACGSYVTENGGWCIIGDTKHQDLAIKSFLREHGAKFVGVTAFETLVATAKLVQERFKFDLTRVVAEQIVTDADVSETALNAQDAGFSIAEVVCRNSEAEHVKTYYNFVPVQCKRVNQGWSISGFTVLWSDRVYFSTLLFSEHYHPEAGTRILMLTLS